MADGGIHQMSEAIGGLKSDVRSLKDSIDNLNRVWGQREEAATEGRRQVHEKVDNLRQDFTRLSAEVENVSQDIVEIKPAIDEFKNARQQAIGAHKLGKLIWGAMLTAAGLSGWAISETLHLWKH